MLAAACFLQRDYSYYAADTSPDAAIIYAPMPPPLLRRCYARARS